MGSLHICAGTNAKEQHDPAPVSLNFQFVHNIPTVFEIRLEKDFSVDANMSVYFVLCVSVRVFCLDCLWVFKHSHISTLKKIAAVI